MKRKLLALLPVMALVACGAKETPLTKEELIEKAGAIATAQETIETPTEFKYVDTLVQESNYGDSFEMTRTIILDDQYASYEMLVKMGEQSSTMAVYAFVKSGDFYLAMNMEGQKQYQKTEIPEGQEITSELLDQLLGMVSGEGTTISGSLDFKGDLLLDATSINNIFLTDEEAAAEGFTTYEPYASTKGEGHLKFGVKAEMGPVELLGFEGEIEETYEWKNNLLVSYVSELTTTSDNGDGTFATDRMYQKTTISYSVKASAPSLSGYQEVTE
jgi:hypothetical protein